MNIITVDKNKVKTVNEYIEFHKFVFCDEQVFKSNSLYVLLRCLVSQKDLLF